MSCALRLSENNVESEIIEKTNSVGGLAKTLSFLENGEEFRTDIGPHRFFSKNQELYNMIENLLGKKWIKVKRQTRQLIEGKFYDYPINAKQAFKNIGFFRATKMGFSYVLGVIKFKLFKVKIKNFQDYIESNFGRALGEFNMLNYTEKIWGLQCSKIHPDWAKQRIKGLNLISALMNALFAKNKNKPKTLVDAFYYPENGTGLIYETIAKEISKKGTKIELNKYPTKIYHKNNKITKIEISDEKNIKTEKDVKTLVNTIPITTFINLLEPKVPNKIKRALKQLKWRAQVYLFITINKKKITNDNWIYLPNKEIPFGRITEMKNFSKKMSPKNKTSMFVEFFVTEGDKIWNMKKEDLFKETIKHFEELNLFKEKDVINYHLIKRKNVYPVYDLNYQTHLEIITKFLDKFENLYYVGRPGRFKYNNQDHSLEMGLHAAESIINGTHVDFDKIGSENEYFEKGELHKSKKNPV